MHIQVSERTAALAGVVAAVWLVPVEAWTATLSQELRDPINLGLAVVLVALPGYFLVLGFRTPRLVSLLRDAAGRRNLLLLLRRLIVWFATASVVTVASSALLRHAQR
jgi:hypothetical protein